jgi:DNA-binding XRE family transcriptional regulator
MSKHPLTEFRERQNLLQVDVARAVGVSRWTITSIETRRRIPSASLIARLVRLSNGALRADDFIPAEVAA